MFCGTYNSYLSVNMLGDRNAGNQYRHITIYKCIIIDNSLGVTIYGHKYNVMHTILVGKIYHTILDECRFYRPFLVQETCMPPSPSYIFLYIHA